MFAVIASNAEATTQTNGLGVESKIQFKRKGKRKSCHFYGVSIFRVPFMIIKPHRGQGIDHILGRLILFFFKKIKLILF